MASSESQARLTQTEPAKWIVVYKNGDQHFAGRRMVVKPREIKTFDSLLEEVTLKLSPSFGAVRNIFTPEGGTRVSSLTDLKPNGKYVASPNEPFRQLSRTRYGEIPVQSTSTSHSRVSLQPVKDKSISQHVGSTGGRRHHAVHSRYRDTGSDELTIHVFRNGDAFSPASPLRVDRMARTHWQQTLTRLGEKLRIGRGVHKLYNLKGQLVRDPATDLEHNGLYVAAADNENFRLVNYGASREPFRSVTRGDSRFSTPHLPCPHQRVAESAPTVCAADSSTVRVAAPQSSSSPPRRASLPPLRVSYPELARRYNQLKEKYRSKRQKHSDREKTEAETAQEGGRKYHSLHQPLHHRPHVQRRLPRPPPRSVPIAPIDIAPIVSPPAAESDGPFSSSSSTTEVDDGSVIEVMYPDSSNQEAEKPRPEPFYLHPLPESGEVDSNVRYGYNTWERQNAERPVDSTWPSEDVEQWADDHYTAEPDGYIVTDPQTTPVSVDPAASHSAPHLSRPPSRPDSREGTPFPSEPIYTRSQLYRPHGTGFYSPGYSPLPEPRLLDRSATPQTPASSPVTVSNHHPHRLAVGGGSPAASWTASEPRLDSRLSGEESESAACEITLVQDDAGELRCVSVLSRAASFPELVSPASPEFAPVVMQRLASRETLRAPVSRGESLVRLSDRMAPLSAQLEDDGSVTPTAAEVESASPRDSSLSEHSLLEKGRERSSSPAAREDEATSLGVIPNDLTSPPGEEIIASSSSPHPPSTCEDVLSTHYRENGSLTLGHAQPSDSCGDSDRLSASCQDPDRLTASCQDPDGLSASCRGSDRLTGSCQDSDSLPASGRQSPVTPELPRPLLSHPVHRDLVIPADEPPSPAETPASGGQDTAPTVAQSLPGVGLGRKDRKLSPKAASVDQMSALVTHSTHSPAAEIREKQTSSRVRSEKSASSSPVDLSTMTSSAEVVRRETPESVAESESLQKHQVSADKRQSITRRVAAALSSRSSSSKNSKLMSSPSSDRKLESTNSSSSNKKSEHTSSSSSASRKSQITQSSSSSSGRKSERIPSSPSSNKKLELMSSPSSNEKPSESVSSSPSKQKPSVLTSTHAERKSSRPPSPPSPSADRDQSHHPPSPPTSVEEAAPSRPLPSPRRRRSMSESSPLSWSGVSAAPVSSGWIWDEVPARPADRAALAAQTAPSIPQMASRVPPAPEEQEVQQTVAAAAESGSKDEMAEEERHELLSEPKEDVESSRKPSSPSEMSESREPEELPCQPVWPLTRTNTPDQTADSGAGSEEGPEPEKPTLTPETDAETSIPRSTTATISERAAEPAAAAEEKGAEAERAPEAIPSDIGQKLDEITSLLRTLLMQNMASRAADGDGGSGGAAPPLGGLTEEQLRALLQPVVADRAATGDSPPHKPR